MNAIETFPTELRPWAWLAHRALGWRVIPPEKGVETHKVHTLFFSEGLREMVHVDPGHQNALVWAPQHTEAALRELEASLSYDARVAYSSALVKAVGIHPSDATGAATYACLSPDMRRDLLLKLVKAFR